MNTTIELAAEAAAWKYGGPYLQDEELVASAPSEFQRGAGVTLYKAQFVEQNENPRSQSRDWKVLQMKVFRDLMSQFAEIEDSSSRIKAATTARDIVSVLEQRGMVRAAKRVVSLAELHESDLDEPEVDLESLRRLATTMISNPALREPQLTLNDKGYMHAEWSTVEKGRIAVTFLPSDLVDFAAISEPVKSGAEIKRISGRHIGVEAINALRWFVAGIGPR